MPRGRLGQRSFGGYSGSPKFTTGYLWSVILPSCYVFLLLLNSRFSVYEDESKLLYASQVFFSVMQC